MRLHTIATAFLMNGDDILMTMRAMTRKIAPGLWYGVGGHIEPAEHHNPEAACLREIHEETGLDASHILDLRLRYIVMRRSHEETVMNFFFFGRTDTRDVAPPEGEDSLHWIPRREALDRPFFPAIGLTLRHWLETDAARPAAGAAENADPDAGSADRLLLGLVTRVDGEPAIHWQEIMDWADPA